MRQVEDVLVVRVRVDRRHVAVLDRERVVEHLGHRRDAVRRARGVRDDVVGSLVIGVVVDAEHDRHVGVRGRRADHDLRRSGVEVLLRAFALREEAGRLDHDVDAEVPPRKVGGIALGEHLELLAGGDDRAVAHFDAALETAEDGVVLEQVPHRLGVTQIVDRDDIDVRALLQLRAKKFRPIRPNPLIPTLTANDPSRLEVPRAILIGIACDAADEHCAGLRPAYGGPEGKLRGRPSPPTSPRSEPWRRTGSEFDAGRARTRSKSKYEDGSRRPFNWTAPSSENSSRQDAGASATACEQRLLSFGG